MAETTKQNGSVATDSMVHPPPRQNEVIGYYEAASFGGDRLRDNVARLIQQSPTIGNYTLDGMSTVLANTSLSYRDWAFATISSLIALGDCTDQLNVYVEGALKHGVEVEEIIDLINHAQTFVGNPRAVNALRAAWSTLSKAQVDLPQGYTESLVRIGDHDTMVRDTHGDKVPIILIHALCMDSKMHKFILPSIHKATGARVIAYDMRGHGYARGAPLTQNLKHLCDDLERLYGALGIETADVYGCSFGGAVAQQFALDRPKRVRSLVPIATAAKATPVLITRAEKAETHGVMPYLPESIIRWFHPETIAENPWCVRYARHCVERARVEEWAHAWRAMSELDVIPRLGELTIPVMSLSGTHDASSTPPLMQQIVDACTNADAEFVSVERGTHMMTMEQPEDCAEKLIAFRKKVDSKYGS